MTFIDPAYRLADVEWQQELLRMPAWQQFKDQHGTWYVEFNESNRKPHKAFGRPIPTSGNTPLERAQNFIQNELQGFRLPETGLVHTSSYGTSKFQYVRFAQQHQGLDVHFAQLFVKMDMQGNVVSFGTDVYDDIAISLVPAIGPQDAVISAVDGLAGVQSTIVSSALGILPVPVYHGVEHHLVYSVDVTAQGGDIPGDFFCLVDANTGKLLYRANRVAAHAPPPPSSDVQLTSTVFEFQPYIPAVELPLANGRLVVNGQTLHSDAFGAINTGITGPVSGTFSLQGPWSTVRSGGVTPSFTMTLQDGPNTVSFDQDANVRERSAFFHVNIVHDHMKGWMPTFTGMDFSLETNVDVGGNCNAFYDGSSINFYAEGNDCQSYAQIGEVVYHEYGHGINDRYYQSLSANFNNGAMGEGYADIWALSITEDPVLAEGSSLSDPADYIRRYDQSPKVYPVDLVGQVHADGEIIAGAWWDTYELLGNDMNAMMTIFIEAYAGLQATLPNGSEGQAFRDVLIDALQADDNDSDITNGTPNGNEIVEAFAIHGITLITNATLDHAAVETAFAATPYTLQADLALTFPFTNYVNTVILSYSVNNSGIWNTVPMTDVGNMTYEVQLPAQPIGTVIAYWMAVEDIFQQLSATVPKGASLPDPNIPYFTLIGYELQATEDADNVNELGNWTTGLPTDNNTTGTWELNIPRGSFSTPGDPSTVVQPDAQHTPGGELCFVTGNAPLITSPVGENDVDGGTTTLISDPIDVSGLDNPTITYWRWYVNNPPTGANPNADWWQVYITDDGQNWVPVEDTKVSDRSWRRKAFRIADHVSTSGTIQIKFNASDSIRIGQNLNGGSLVEAAVDDIQLWVNADPDGVVDRDDSFITQVYPDPASDVLNIALDLGPGAAASLQVVDMGGRILIQRDLGALAGEQVRQLDVSALANGSYLLRVLRQDARSEARFQVVR